MTGSIDEELVEAGVFSRLELRLAKGVNGQHFVRVAVKNLRRIYRRVCDIRRERSAAYVAADIKPNTKLTVVTAAELLAQPIKSRVDCVDTAEEGLGYAARMIGVMVHYVGGDDLLENLSDAFLASFDGRDYQLAASWISHRWDGIGDWHA